MKRMKNNLDERQEQELLQLPVQEQVQMLLQELQLRSERTELQPFHG